MSRSRHHPRIPPPALWRRLTALGSAGLTLVLSLFAANPEAHAWLHSHTDASHAAAHADCSHGHEDSSPVDAATDDAGCVITQFANGQVGCEVDPTAVFAAALQALATLADPGATFAGSADLQLPPGCGPPQV